MRWRITSLALVVVCGIAVAFAPETRSQPTTVNFGQISKSATSWPLMIAHHEGFFQRRGIQISAVISRTTAETSQALVGGSTDFAQVNLVSLLAAVGGGADVAAVAGYAAVPIVTLIVHPSITTYSALRGKTLAVAGPTDPLNYLLSQMLSANGLTPRDYSFLSIGASSERMAAVQSGHIAGALLNPPSDFTALAQGFRSLGRSTDFVDRFQYAVMAARRNWLQQHKKLVVDFLSAYIEGCKFFYNPRNKDEAVRILIQETGINQSLAEQTYELYYQAKKMIPLRGEIDVEGVRIVSQQWRGFGLRREPPPVEQVIDLSYLDEAERGAKANK